MVAEAEAMELGENIMEDSSALDEVVTVGYGVKKEEINEHEKIDLSAVKIRKNFNETAFFFPHLKTDKEGSVSFSFTIPEAFFAGLISRPFK